jgi:hypothetical protein
LGFECCRNLADVAQNHGGMLYPSKRHIESARNSLLHQTLMQPRAHFTSEDFNEALDFDRGGLAQQGGD